jgi:uncharacterized ion transporter superfamily protein YfcC
MSVYINMCMCVYIYMCVCVCVCVCVYVCMCMECIRQDPKTSKELGCDKSGGRTTRTTTEDNEDNKKTFNGSTSAS